MTGDLTPQPQPQALIYPAVLDALRPVIAKAGSPVYLVGGAVRDALLHKPVHDFDFVTGGDALRVARQIANAFRGAFYPLDAERGVGRAIIQFEEAQVIIDVARFRGADLAADLAARDFTMNALAVDMGGDPNAIIDPLDGLLDLKAKRLRRCAAGSLAEDPIRVLRAIRQAAEYGMLIEPQTRVDVKANAGRIFETSIERVRDELVKALEGVKTHAVLRGWDAVGLLAQIIPEVGPMRGVTQSAPHIYDVWEHTLQAVQAAGRVLAVISPNRTDETAADGFYGMIVYRLDRYRKALQAHLTREWPGGRTSRATILLATLLHDCGKPATRSVGEDGRVHFYRHELVGADLARERLSALRFSSDEIERVTGIIRNHMRPLAFTINGPQDPKEINISRRALHRFWRATGDAGVDVCILTQADYLATYGVTLDLKRWLAHLEVVAQLLEAWFMQREQIVAPVPLLNGDGLMQALDLKPGPELGVLIRAIIEGQAAGEIMTVEEALVLARTMLAGGLARE